MWHWYDRREERSVNDVLKMCGTHIQQLVFPGNPGCISSSTAVEMVQHCCNVTKISLATCLSGDDVWKVVELIFLQKLRISCINSVPIKPIFVACLKMEVVLDVSYELNMKSIDHMYERVDAGFKPPNLSIINGCYDSMKFIGSWPKWDNKISAGHVAHYKAYSTDWYS